MTHIESDIYRYALEAIAMIKELRMNGLISEPTELATVREISESVGITATTEETQK